MNPNKAIFYHAGCPICLDAERRILDLIDTKKFQVEVVHLAQDKSRLPEAKKLGVKSVPALVLGEDVLHINFGASISDLE